MNSPVTVKSEASRADWSGLWLRIQRSCVTTLDLFRILVFDAIILLFGNGAVHLIAKWIGEGDGFFMVATKLSHGLFLLLYSIVVCFHLKEFFKDQRQSADANK